ncbi:12509_t:CDS:2, partial [Funneliformis geosporum]
NIENFIQIGSDLSTEQQNNIILVETILSVYRYKIITNNTILNEIHDVLPIFNAPGYVWDESACELKLNIEDDVKVI